MKCVGRRHAVFRVGSPGAAAAAAANVRANEPPDLYLRNYC